MPPQLVWYAIRRKSTGRLLPAPLPKHRGGQTHMSFEDDGLPPRLFASRHGAHVSMKLWLRGDWIAKEFKWEEYVKRHRGNIKFTNPRTHLEGDVEVIAVCVKQVEVERVSIFDDEAD